MEPRKAGDEKLCWFLQRIVATFVHICGWKWRYCHFLMDISLWRQKQSADGCHCKGKRNVIQ
jgi:hypothetical protein